MAKISRMNRNWNHGDASSRKRFKTCDNSGATPWPDLNHDMLFLVMMQLGVIDFLAFSGVCKSWRSFAHSNRNTFMTSRSPMSISIKDRPYKKECYLKDFEGRKFKTLLPNSVGRSCVGLTCGYLILFGSKAHDFWLVNPITRHELYFPPFPCLAKCDPIEAILVSSPSISGWVMVAFRKYSQSIWVSIAGKEFWYHVSSAYPLLDLLAFKGNIYTLHTDSTLCKMKLNPEPKLKILKTKTFPKPELDFFHQEFVSAGGNLYVWDRNPDKYLFGVRELDFGKMKWVSPEEKAIRQYTFFLSELEYSVAIKPESWTDSQLLQYRRIYLSTEKCREASFNIENMWYFPHDCLNVNLIHE